MTFLLKYYVEGFFAPHLAHYIVLKKLEQLEHVCALKLIVFWREHSGAHLRFYYSDKVIVKIFYAKSSTKK